MAAHTPTAAAVAPLPQASVAFDATALSQWVPDPAAAYNRIVHADREWGSDQPVEQWMATLDRELPALPLNRCVMLMNHCLRYALANIVIVVTRGVHDDGAMSATMAYPMPNIERLLLLLRRMRLDRQGWDYVATVLFIIMIDLITSTPHRTAVIDRLTLVNSIRVIAARLLPRLIHLTDDARVNTFALTLTWSHVVALAREWKRQMRYISGVPFLASVDFLDPFLARAEKANLEAIWNEPFVQAEREMRNEAHRTQNVLMHPSSRFHPDTIGMIAQCLAPPGTSQGALEAQRDAYAESVRVARAQVELDRAHTGQQ